MVDDSQLTQLSVSTYRQAQGRESPDEFLAARKTYYEMAGWDPQTRKPTDAKLAELAIG